MDCPRCGASGFDGVCSYCGFPVMRSWIKCKHVFVKKRIKKDEDIVEC